MAKDFVDVFEELFGPYPEDGLYKFKSLKVELVNNDNFKGFAINWVCEGIGFGEYFFGFGNNPDWPRQNGFYSDSEFSSKEFVQQLLLASLPQLVEIVDSHDICK